MAILSILLGCHTSRNPHANIGELIATIAASCIDQSQVEVLVKLDETDPSLQQHLDSIAATRQNVLVKPLISPRSRGFADLHKAYNDLMLTMSDDSEAIWVLSDDARIVARGIDSCIKEVTEQRDIFVLLSPQQSQRMPSIDYRRSFYFVDPYPLWSRRFLEICGGFPLLNCSDSWTIQLLRMIKHRYNLDLHLPWPAEAVERLMYEEDDVQVAGKDISPEHAARVARTEAMIEEMRQVPFRRLLEQQAHNLYLNILAGDKFGDPHAENFVLPQGS